MKLTVANKDDKKKPSLHFDSLGKKNLLLFNCYLCSYNSSCMEIILWVDSSCSSIMWAKGFFSSAFSASLNHNLSHICLLLGSLYAMNLKWLTCLGSAKCSLCLSSEKEMCLHSWQIIVLEPLDINKSEMRNNPESKSQI